jgi:hypothetical protein
VSGILLDDPISRAHGRDPVADDHDRPVHDGFCASHSQEFWCDKYHYKYLANATITHAGCQERVSDEKIYIDAAERRRPSLGNAARYKIKAFSQLLQQYSRNANAPLALPWGAMVFRCIGPAPSSVSFAQGQPACPSLLGNVYFAGVCNGTISLTINVATVIIPMPVY